VLESASHMSPYLDPGALAGRFCDAAARTG
jgi:hypothetical protein